MLFYRKPNRFKLKKKVLCPMTKRNFQEKVADFNGESIFAFTIENANGIKVTALNYGCTITEILTPDQHGETANIVLRYDHTYDYVENPYYLGSVVGRLAGRTRSASFELNGKRYELPQNENQNHIHGGYKGFTKRVWKGRFIEKGMQFFYRSPDGEEGYPGNIDMTVTYELTDDNTLEMTYSGIPDEDTVLNVTNHTYFNLRGDAETPITGCELAIDSDRYVELDDEFLPTGNVLPVTNSEGCFDFREGKTIRDGIACGDPQLTLVGGGFDHPFLLNQNQEYAVRLTDPVSGRQVEVATDKESVVLYTGNNLDGSFPKHAGLCLETQHVPDAIHHSQFTSPLVKKGEIYESKTVLKFSVNR